MTPVVQRDYINVSQVSQQITNETYFDSDGAPMNDANDPTGPTSGWRDTGIQLFDSFKTGDWEHTYALMAGTGTGLAIYNGMGTGRPDWHLYWSSEWVFGGMGHTREGWKLTGWYQDGNREIRVGTAQREETFDRTRYGLGTTFRKGPWRAEAEWIGAEGMIYNGTDSMAIPGSIGKMGNKTSLPPTTSCRMTKRTAGISMAATASSTSGRPGFAMTGSTGVPHPPRPSGASTR